MTAPAPFLPKPSILDRVLGRLIPTDQYGSLLDPTQQRAIQRQGLIGLGTGILAQGGPGSGPLQAFGKAYQGLDIPGMADHALQVKAYQTKLQEKDSLQQVIAAHPRKPGQSDYDYVASLLAATAGMPGSSVNLASAADALKQSPRTGGTHVVPLKDGIYLVHDDGTKIRVGPPPDKAPKEPTPAERVAASQAHGVEASLMRMQDIERDHPEAVEQVAAVLSSGKIPWIGKGIEAYRSLGLSGPANEYLTEAKNFLLATTPTYGGARPTEQLLALEAAASIPSLKEGPAARAAKVLHRNQRLKDVIAKAGKAATVDEAPPSDATKPRYPENPY